MLQRSDTKDQRHKLLKLEYNNLQNETFSHHISTFLSFLDQFLIKILKLVDINLYNSSSRMVYFHIK